MQHDKGDRRGRSNDMPVVVRIKANNVRGYAEAEMWDCVWLTFTEGRHTPVLNPYGKVKISGTVTTRPGELGVVVP